MQTAFRSEAEFTQDEFFDWVQKRPGSDIHHYELLGGHIVMTPPAGYPHSPMAVHIVAALWRYVKDRQLGIVNESSAGYELPTGDTVEPDVSFISAATWNAGPRPSTGKFYRLVPDLLVEIVSPTTARRDAVEKRAIYERSGVAEYWLVDPKAKSVTVLRLIDGRYADALLVTRGSVLSSVVPGFELEVAGIFADPGEG